MRFPVFASLLVVFGTASALPAEIESREPSNNPIDLANKPPAWASFVCGADTYTGHDIYLAVQRAVNLYLVGETRGKWKYPHKFIHNESKKRPLNFPEFCPEHDERRKEFPLKKGGPYDGGSSNITPGSERVVYYFVDEDINYNGNPRVYFCGIMTHKGLEKGALKMCY